MHLGAAIHEAGHAVAAELLGLREVGAGKRSGAVMDLPHLDESREPARDPVGERFDRFWSEAKHLLRGTVAHQIENGARIVYLYRAGVTDAALHAAALAGAKRLTQAFLDEYDLSCVSGSAPIRATAL